MPNADTRAKNNVHLFAPLIWNKAGRFRDWTMDEPKLDAGPP